MFCGACYSSFLLPDKHPPHRRLSPAHSAWQQCSKLHDKKQQRTKNRFLQTHDLTFQVLTSTTTRLSPVRSLQFLLAISSQLPSAGRESVWQAALTSPLLCPQPPPQVTGSQLESWAPDMSRPRPLLSSLCSKMHILPFHCPSQPECV